MTVAEKPRHAACARRKAVAACGRCVLCRMVWSATDRVLGSAHVHDGCWRFLVGFAAHVGRARASRRSTDRAGVEAFAAAQLQWLVMCDVEPGAVTAAKDDPACAERSSRSRPESLLQRPIECGLSGPPGKPRRPCCNAASGARIAADRINARLAIDAYQNALRRPAGSRPRTAIARARWQPRLIRRQSERSARSMRRHSPRADASATRCAPPARPCVQAARSS